MPLVGLPLVLVLLVAQSMAATPSASPVSHPIEARCQPVDAGLVEVIEGGITEGIDATLRNVWAVRSNDYELMWFVAGDLEGPGFEGDWEIAVFGTTMLDDRGDFDPTGEILIAANGPARDATDWPDGVQGTTAVTMMDDGSEIARGCASTFP